MNHLPRTFRPIALALMLALLAITWVLFAPPALGGRTNFVIVNGNSMEPLYARGDLVLVRAAETYHVGDIVTYRHPQIGPIIHRIIGQNDDRWMFKGDHNSFVDPYQPRDGDLIGRAVFHIPLVGGLLMAIRDPRIIAVLAAGVGVLFMQRSTISGRTRRKQQKLVGIHPNAGLFGVAAFLTLVALGLSAWAYIQPLQRMQTEEIPYTHTSTFSYNAAAPAGIYDGNAATTGEPIFWQLSNQLDVAFEYHLETDAPAALRGTAQLDATLSSADGWRRTMVLSPQQAFDGTVPMLHGTVDLAHIRTLIDGLETSAGLPRREYLLTISPHIKFDGTLAGETFADSFGPKLVLRSDEFQLSLVRDAEQDPLVPATGAILKHQTSVEQTVLPGVPFSVAHARIAVPAIFFVMLLVTGSLGHPLLRRFRRDEAARIRLKYGALLADATSVVVQPHAEIAVSTIDALARIAERHGTLMLHDAIALPPRYLVCVGETVYSYQPTATNEQPIAAETQVVVRAPLHVQTGWHGVFLHELRLRGLASEACRTAGVALTEAYREREHNAAFARAWDNARAAALSERSIAA